MKTTGYCRSTVITFTVGLLVLLSAKLHSQTNIPAKCFEIESILVDACVSGGGCSNASSPACSCEGKNEMVRFRVGINSILLSGISVTWPNNSFLGLVQNSLTATLTATLNSSIQSCGYLVEPPGGVIPAGAQVLLITSTDMCTSSNSFATLSDTLYVIYQNAGNYQGHFANTNNSATVSSTPSGPSNTRTLIMRYTPTMCSDTAVYDRSLLVNTLGTYGGSTAQNDGSTVLFSWPGFPAAQYVNFGCQAPYVPLSIVSVSGNGSYCNSSPINVSATIGGTSASVFWSGGSGTFSNSSALSTTYTPGVGETGSVTLLFSAVSGCGDTISAPVQLTLLSLPAAQITASGPLAICNNNSVTLNASGGSSYLWSTSATTQSITVNVPGTYIVAASNTCGTDTQSVVVSALPFPAAQITAGGPLSICSGDSVLLTASGGDTYSWNNADTSAAVWATQPGNYIVTASNLCGSDTAQINVSFLPGAAAAITASGPLSICSGDSLQLTASGGSSYVWSTSATTSSIWITQTGTYTVSASGLCGSDTASVTITQQSAPAAQISAGGPLSLCPGDSVLLTASGGNSYVWSNAALTTSIWVAQAGTYIVNVSNNCGSDTAQVQISALQLPSVFITPSGSQTLCPGDSLLLTASGSGNYLWSTGATSAAVYATSPGTYSVTATNSCGTASATQSVVAGVLPAAVISGNTSICSGDTALLSVTGGSTYSWNTGSTASSISVTAGGVYSVIAFNTCGSDTAQITVNSTQATASFTADFTSGTAPLSVDFTDASAANTVSWLWDFGNGNTSTSSSPQFTFTFPGIYTVTLQVTNSAGCTDLFSMVITVNGDASFVQMPNVFTPNGDGINDLYLAETSGIETFDLHIYDRWGIEVSHITRVAQGWDGRTTSGTEVTEGTYYYVLRASGFDQRVYELAGYFTLLRN